MKVQIIELNSLLLFFLISTNGKPEQMGERAAKFRTTSNKIDNDGATNVIDKLGPKRANNAFERVNKGKEPYTITDKARIKVGEAWDDVKNKFTETRGSVSSEKSIKVHTSKGDFDIGKHTSDRMTMREITQGQLT